MHPISTQYRILDVFEKNPLQSLMLGASHEQPDEIAVINEILWNPLFTRELAASLYEGFIGLKSHSEDQASCQLVTAYHPGMPIGKYLSSRSLSFRTRINFCYEFLKAMVSYNSFPAWTQDILIDEDQIIVHNDQLMVNELFILKTDDAAYADRISFADVQRKVHQILSNLISGGPEASPALLAFMDRLGRQEEALGDLQAIYDEFQKVYLYDYYLNLDHGSPPVTPVVLPSDEHTVPVDELPFTEDFTFEEADLQDFQETDASNPEYIEADAEVAPIPTESIAAAQESPEEDPMVSGPADVLADDDIDPDMEKNLELFFSKNQRSSETSEAVENRPDRRRRGLWLVLGVMALLLIVWGGLQLFGSSKKPVADFTGTYENGLWQLKNQSTYPGETTLNRSEWTIYQGGKLINLYDTEDLALALEEEGVYQIVLRVMDSNGTWSAPVKKALEHFPSGAAASASKPEDAASGNESSDSEAMDQYTLKYSPQRTQVDTAFFRNGSYSLQITPDKKPEILEVQGIMVDKNGMVSLWIASENTEAITLSFTGKNQNNRVFTRDIVHKPLAPRQWEMIQFTIEADRMVNNIAISVRTNALINLDDLNIDSYK